MSPPTSAKCSDRVAGRHNRTHVGGSGAHGGAPFVARGPRSVHEKSWGEHRGTTFVHATVYR